MSELIQQITEELIKRMNSEREKLIDAKLKQRGYSVTLADQMKYRFKDIICEAKGNEETWWYNDGTYQGERIITFINDFPEMEFKDGEGFKINNYLKYY